VNLSIFGAKAIYFAVPLFQLTDDLVFPDPRHSEENGLLAVGGDLDPTRILLGYENGIFPWFNAEDPILWWSPDPRYVLYPNRLKVSKSMKQLMRKGRFELSLDRAFSEVISNCGIVKRDGEQGSWITSEMEDAYNALHDLGVAHSSEAWLEGELVGGLYGVCLGGIFFGESMFHKASNASKAAFIHLVDFLKNNGIEIIDCQMHTDHLESLGGEHITKERFLKELGQALKKESLIGSWTVISSDQRT